jgi:hypothetical protein
MILLTVVSAETAIISPTKPGVIDKTRGMVLLLMATIPAGKFKRLRGLISRGLNWNKKKEISQSRTPSK